MLFTIFNFIKKKIFTNLFVKWLLRDSSTEIKLDKTSTMLNFRITCFNEYLKNSHKHLTNSSIIQIKNQNKRIDLLNFKKHSIVDRISNYRTSYSNKKQNKN